MVEESISSVPVPPIPHEQNLCRTLLAQRPSEAQSNRLCDPSMGEQNLLWKAASFRGQWLTELFTAEVMPYYV